ncbi:MAG: hypothetical protein K0S08_1507 [Gammaproteobacteria bacterium]|jgi:hypothetical protein|nr:hypothetical protein [Gammaproteobacteria bacterium]
MQYQPLKILLTIIIGISTSAIAFADDPTIITLFNQQGTAPVTQIGLKINLPTGEECLPTPIWIPATTYMTTVTQKQLKPECVGKQDFAIYVAGDFAKEFKYSAPAKLGAVCRAVHNGRFITRIDLSCDPALYRQAF